MISIIIPTYNRLKLLKLTLDNLFRQTLRATEIIVIDDHSTDGTYEYLLKELSHKVIALQTIGKGPAAARNTGLRIATGNYIQFFDSDDLITLNKLEVQSNMLSKSSNSIVIGPYVKALEQNGTWKQLDAIMQYNKPPDYLGLDEWVLRGWCSITQACLFKTDLIKEVGFWNEKLMPHEDLEYWFRLSKLNPYPLHTNEACVIYQQHGEQITENSTSYQNKVADGMQALHAIESHKNKKYNSLTETIFQSRLYRQQKLLPSPKHRFSKEVQLLLYRTYNKYERYKTQSNWERMHGVNSDPKAFHNYLEIL